MQQLPLDDLVIKFPRSSFQGLTTQFPEHGDRVSLYAFWKLLPTLLAAVDAAVVGMRLGH